MPYRDTVNAYSMRRLFAIIFFLNVLGVTLSSAQKYRGVVVDTIGNALSGVTITLLYNNRPVAYAQSKQDGRFIVACPEKKQVQTIRLRKMGYADITLSLDKFKEGATYILHEKPFELKEVKVIPNKAKVEGDTVTYLVSAYMQKQDRRIADVLSKIPGIEVRPSGQIVVNNQPINKFYIEGMDLLGGNYSLASENIDAAKVSKVQVLNNHQPVRVLRDVSFSDQAALNIVLKDDAKNIWQGVLDVAGGHTLQGNGAWLRDARLMTMLFAHKRQSISMYKTNNTGKDIGREITDLSANDFMNDDGERLSSILIQAPSLDMKRYAFNDSHVFATNWLFKPTDNADLRLQLDGLLDKTQHNMFRQTTFLDATSDGAMVSESSNAFGKRNEWKGELLYKLNSDKTYLSNSLKGYMDFNYSRGATLLNGSDVKQDVEPRKRYIANTLRLIQNLSGGHRFSFNTKLRYSFLPGNVLLMDGNEEYLGIHHLSLKTSAYFRHRLAGAYIAWTIGEEYDNYHQGVEHHYVSNKDRYSLLKLYASPSFSYKSRMLSLSAIAKLSWNSRCFNEANQQHIAFEPSVSLEYSLSPYLKTHLDYLYTWSPGSLDAISSSPVYTDYITLVEGLGRLVNSNVHFVSNHWQYTNPVHGFSASTSFSYNHSSNNLLYSSSYSDGIYIRRATTNEGNTSSYILNGRIAKSIGWGKLSLALTGNISWYQYYLLISGNKTLVRQRNGNMGLELSWHPCTWLSVEGKSRMNHIVQNSPSQAISRSAFNYFSHSVDVFLMPGKWQIEWRNEYYHSNDATISNNYFCDVNVCYRTRSYEVGLSCTNIFGTIDYERTVISDYLRTFTINTLHPRALLCRFSWSI